MSPVADRPRLASARGEAVEQAVAAGGLERLPAAAARGMRGVPGARGVVVAQALLTPPSNSSPIVLRSFVAEGERVVAILVTHCHIDHSPLAARLPGGKRWFQPSKRKRESVPLLKPSKTAGLLRRRLEPRPV